VLSTMPLRILALFVIGFVLSSFAAGRIYRLSRVVFESRTLKDTESSKDMESRLALLPPSITDLAHSSHSEAVDVEFDGMVLDRCPVKDAVNPELVSSEGSVETWSRTLHSSK
jgi:hypothetical protein